MRRHPVSFDQLADWVDGRLEERAQAEVGAHLVAGCTACQRDLVWLQRVISAAKSDAMVDPPMRAIRWVKTAYREKVRRATQESRSMRRFGSTRPAWGLAALVLIVVSSMLVASQIPFLRVRPATLSASRGRVEVRAAGMAEWQEVAPGMQLCEGDTLRVLEDVAALALFEGSSLEMQPGTLLALSTLRAGILGGSHRIVLAQQSGSVDYRVASLRSPLSTFEAQAPSVRVTVRGTRFVVTVEEEAGTRVTVLQGSVWLVNPVDQAVLQEREAALVSPGALVTRLPTLLPTATALPTAPELAVTASPDKAAGTSTPPALPGARSPSAVRPQLPQVVPAPDAATLRPSQVARPRSTLQPTAAVKPVLAPTATALPNLAEYHGIVEAFPPQVLGRWRIGGRDFVTTKDTRIIGKPEVGAWAKVLHVEVRSSARDHSEAVALLIEVREHLSRPSSTPTSSVWVRPSATRTSSTEVVSPETRTPQLTQTATVSRTPQHAETALPAITAGATGALRTTPTRVPAQTPWAASTAVSEPHPSATLPRPKGVLPHASPTPSRTAAPATSRPAPSPLAPLVRFNGIIERVPAQRLGLWMIAGRAVTVTSDSDVAGRPPAGVRADVEARFQPGGVLLAVRIVVYNP